MLSALLFAPQAVFLQGPLDRLHQRPHHLDAGVYESRVGGEELALIADLGGGTSDISIVRVSPARHLKALHYMAEQPERVHRLLRVVREQTGHPLAGDVETRKIVDSIHECLNQAGVDRDAITTLFLTGGTSAVPAVRAACEATAPGRWPATASAASASV